MSLESVDHVAAALNRLPVQFADKPKIRALLSSYAGAVQEVEDAFQDLLLLRRIDVATGDSLTRLGTIVGQPRQGITDDDVYRRYVRARIAANRSRGTSRDILRIARSFLPSADFTLRLDNIGRAAYQLIIDGALTSELADALIILLKRGTSAGVRATLESSDAAIDSTFTIARSAFLVSGGFAGLSSLLVGVGDTAGWAAHGTLVIDEGLATQELLDYSGITPEGGGDRIYLDGVTVTAFAHLAGDCVRSDDQVEDGRGFPKCAFISGLNASGSGVLAITRGLSLPASGDAVIGEGLATQETVTYASRTSTTLTLSGVTTLGHVDGEAIAFLGGGSNQGGTLAGVRRA